ncbi:MAG: lysoplasmalogenase [Eubacteriales bacterium]
MFIPFIFAGALLCLLPFYVWTEYHWSQEKFFFLKLACSLLFLATAISALFFYVDDPANKTYAIMIIAALGFGLIGDCFLVFPEKLKYFIIGLASFLVGQIIYGINFMMILGVSWIDALVYAAIIGLIVWLFKIGKMEFGKMKKPVIAYVVAITFMITLALSGLYKTGLSPLLTVMVAASAVLFLASDVLLGFMRFAPVQHKCYRATNLVLYYIAQLIFALTIVFVG